MEMVMLKRLLQATTFLFLGAVGSLCTRSFAGTSDGGDGPIWCSKCLAGIGIWNEVFTVTTASGVNCRVTTVWWTQDGECWKTRDGCVEYQPCAYIVQTQNTCGAEANQFLYLV